MRVLLAGTHGEDASVGGAERYVGEIRRLLERHGAEATILAAFPPGPGAARADVVLHDGDWRTDRRLRLRCHAGALVAPVATTPRWTVSGDRPDVVHTHNLFGIDTGIWEQARRCGIPVVHTLHDYGLLCPRTTLLRPDGAPCRPHPALCGLRTRRLARWAGGVTDLVGVSRHVLDAHRGIFPAGVRTHVVPAAGSPAMRVPPPGSSLRRIGYVGRLTEPKGVALLVAAAPRLAALGVSVAVAGAGPLRDVVAACPEIDFRGRLAGPDLAAFISGCDAGIVPSVWAEPGLSYAALDWIAAGRPVFATTRGGLGELPDGGVCRIEADAQDLTAAVASHRVPAALDGLRATLPTPERVRSRHERFAADHLRLYAAARGV